ncbi:unnamed protein product [Tetraodon nigroviridis]|uniref:Chromosome 3 SCAF14707, whole genome shotgun sequence n=1 Tax=Tetraodon nigroviridis TaxID=99883 RepID=Q4S8A2_TETNG|nr:unnamed protein product [Tetraodon nigroviridis]
MAALWLRVLPLFCLPCVALSNPEQDRVVWKELGESVTIHCSVAMAPLLLSLKKGLHRSDVYSTSSSQSPGTTSREVEGRLKVNGEFPNLDLVISNLTAEDTGPYWCEYTEFEKKMVTKDGNGAILLVVNEKECAEENTHLLLGALVGCAALLLIIIIGFSVWIIPKIITRKAKRTISNDVYEDMRGTLRR